MERVHHLLVHRPKTVLFLVVLLTGFFAYHAWHIRIDSSVESLLPRDDPEKQYYDEARRLFGNDDITVIGLVTEDVYTPATLEKIRRITQQIEKIDGVQSVRSLTNVPDPIADLSFPPLLIPQIATDAAALAALRRKIEEQYPIYLNLVTKDAKGAAIIVYFKPLSDDEFLNKKIDDQLQSIVAREQGPEQLYLTGMQNIKVKSLEMMKEDLVTFTPLSLAVIMGVLGFCFRNLRGVLLPLLSVLCGVVWTLGIMVLTGEAITIGTLVLPSLLIVIGSTYSIYVIAQYEEERQKGGTAAEVIWRTLSRVSVPVTVAAFTTEVGFVTLLVTRIPTIRALGLYAAFGFASVTVIVLTLIPATLVLLPLSRRRRASTDEGRLTVLLARVGQFNRNYQKPIIVVAALMILPCLWGIRRIRADSDFLKFFQPQSAVRRANEIINERIGGTQIFSVVVNSGQKGGVVTPDLLKRIKCLQRHLATVPGVDQTLSLADYADLVDRGLHNNSPAEGDIVVDEAGAQPSSAPAAAPMTPLWDLLQCDQPQGEAAEQLA